MFPASELRRDIDVPSIEGDFARSESEGTIMCSHVDLLIEFDVNTFGGISLMPGLLLLDH